MSTGPSLRAQFYATRPISRDNLVPEDARARPDRVREPERPRAVAAHRGRPHRRARRQAPRPSSTCSTSSSRAAASTSRSPRRPWRSTTSPSRACSSTATRRAREITRLDRRHDARPKLARVLALLAPVELLSAMQKMRVRRTPSIQAHVTNRVDHPLLLAADAASAVALGFRELETTVPLLRDAPLNAVALLVGGQVPRAGRAHAVRGRGAPRARARHARPDDVRRDGLGLRHRAGLRRRRRHALVEGVPGLLLRLARAQDALHLGLRGRVPDGRDRGLLDALPRGALPGRDARGRLAGHAERRHRRRQRRRLGARRHARGDRREPAAR